MNKQTNNPFIQQQQRKRTIGLTKPPQQHPTTTTAFTSAPTSAQQSLFVKLYQALPSNLQETSIPLFEDVVATLCSRQTTMELPSESSPLQMDSLDNLCQLLFASPIQNNSKPIEETKDGDDDDDEQQLVNASELELPEIITEHLFDISNIFQRIEPINCDTSLCRSPLDSILSKEDVETIQVVRPSSAPPLLRDVSPVILVSSLEVPIIGEDDEKEKPNEPITIDHVISSQRLIPLPTTPVLSAINGHQVMTAGDISTMIVAPQPKKIEQILFRCEEENIVVGATNVLNEIEQPIIVDDDSLVDVKNFMSIQPIIVSDLSVVPQRCLSPTMSLVEIVDSDLNCSSSTNNDGESSKNMKYVPVPNIDDSSSMESLFDFVFSSVMNRPIQGTYLGSIEIHLRPYWNTDYLLDLKESLIPVPEIYQLDTLQPLTKTNLMFIDLMNEKDEDQCFGVQEEKEELFDSHSLKPQTQANSLSTIPSLDFHQNRKMTNSSVRESLDDFIKTRNGKQIPKERDNPIEVFSQMKLTIPAIFCNFLPFHISIANFCISSNTCLLLSPELPLLPITAILIHNFLSITNSSKILWIYDNSTQNGENNQRSSYSFEAPFNFLCSFLSRIGENLPTLIEEDSSLQSFSNRITFISARKAETQLFTDKSTFREVGFVIFEPKNLVSPNSSICNASKALISSFSPRVLVLAPQLPQVTNTNIVPISNIIETMKSFGVSQFAFRTTFDSDVHQFLNSNRETQICQIDESTNDLLRGILTINNGVIKSKLVNCLLSNGVLSTFEYLSTTIYNSGEYSDIPGIQWLLSKFERAVQEVDAGIFSGNPPIVSSISQIVSNLKQNQQLHSTVLVVVSDSFISNSPDNNQTNDGNCFTTVQSITLALEKEGNEIFTVAPNPIIQELRELASFGTQKDEEIENVKIRVTQFDVLVVSVKEIAWNFPWNKFSAIICCGETLASCSILKECSFLYQIPHIFRLILSNSNGISSSSTSMSDENDHLIQLIRTKSNSTTFDSPINSEFFYSAVTNIYSHSQSLSLVPLNSTSSMSAMKSTSETNNHIVVIGTDKFFEDDEILQRIRSRKIDVVRRCGFEPNLRLIISNSDSCILIWSETEEKKYGLNQTIDKLINGPFLSCCIILECHIPLDSRAVIGLSKSITKFRSVKLCFSTSFHNTANLIESLLKETSTNLDYNQSSLLEDENPHETFLTKLGMNPFASQIILGVCNLHEIMFSQQDQLISKLTQMETNINPKLIERLFKTIQAYFEKQQQNEEILPISPIPKHKSIPTPKVTPTKNRQQQPKPEKQQIQQPHELVRSALDAKLDELERESSLCPPTMKRSKSLGYELPFGQISGQSKLVWVQKEQQRQTQEQRPQTQRKPITKQVTKKIVQSNTALTTESKRKEIISKLEEFFALSPQDDDDNAQQTPSTSYSATKRVKH